MPFVGGGGRGHRTALARVVALGGAGAAGAAPLGVVAMPRGGRAVQAGPGGGSGMVALRGAGELWAGVSCEGETGALPFAGPGPVVGRVGPLRRHPRGLGGPAWCRRVLGGGGGSPPPMDLPRTDVAPVEVDAAAVAAGGTGPLVVRGVVPARGRTSGACTW